MNVQECIEAMEKARAALDAHYRFFDKKLSGGSNDLGIEARKRLGQMIWLLAEVGNMLAAADEAQSKLPDLHAQLKSGEISEEELADRSRAPEYRAAVEKAMSFIDPIETLTESFYWIASRARGVIRELPGMRSFEAEGIRNTRNKLLEHPGGSDSGVLMTSFAYGGENGPTVKAIRRTGQEEIFPDRGLFANAKEFAYALFRTATESVMQGGQM